ncbi:hypothetical protein Btru_000550 [Bulinus truncatus]|nr:hypothetical protein Btru_000550 [Bulinus truncatus]
MTIESGFHYHDKDTAVCSHCENKLPLINVTSKSDLSRQEFHKIGCDFVNFKKGRRPNDQRRSSTICLDHLPHTDSKDYSQSVDQESTVHIQTGPIVEQQENVAADDGLQEDEATGSETETTPALSGSRNGLVLRKVGRKKRKRNPARSQNVSLQEFPRDSSSASNGQSSKSQSKFKVCYNTTISLNGSSSFPRFKDFHVRHKTLKTSPFKNKAADLAGAGFYYTGSGGRIRCYHCGLGFKDWQQNDDIVAEHSRHTPSCPVTRNIKETPHRRRPSPRRQPSPRGADNTYDMTDGHTQSLRTLQEYLNSPSSDQFFNHLTVNNRTLSREEAMEESKRAASFQANHCPYHLQRMGYYLAQNWFYWTGKQCIIQCSKCQQKLYVDHLDDAVSNHRNLQPS